ncbi:MAG TPA: transposase [Polyangiaceae bacterium]|nr:transposase [Polyangiaceae bacterium]
MALWGQKRKKSSRPAKPRAQEASRRAPSPPRGCVLRVGRATTARVYCRARPRAHSPRVLPQPPRRADALLRNGRLVLSNNWAERAIKPVATGRKAWLFCGSDDHAKSAATLFSLVGSARLHGLDPEEYLRCLIRLVPLWPPERMLELSPLLLKRTRERLDADALSAEFGSIRIPAEPLDTTCPSQNEAPTAS